MYVRKYAVSYDIFDAVNSNSIGYLDSQIFYLSPASDSAEIKCERKTWRFVMEQK